MSQDARRLLTEAGFLPEVLPENFTYRKVRELLADLERCGQAELGEAVRAAKKLQISGPTATLIFIKHHLEGEHEAEIDRLDESEEGIRYGVLVYAEGEVPVRAEYFPGEVSAGSRVRYDPVETRYK
jgi:hypothetical protein